MPNIDEDMIETPDNDEELVLSAESNSKAVEPTDVVLSDSVVSALKLKSNKASLVEKGEVESVVEVNGKSIVVGNETITEEE